MGTDALTTAQRHWLDALTVRYERDAPLGPRTWYGVGGRAAALAHPSDAAQLAALVTAASQRSERVRVLGKGANLLVREGLVGGVVVTLDEPGFRQIEIDEASGRVVAGAGADLERLITMTVRAGLAGLEGLAGIPATVGGAARMNAGGAFGEVGRAIESVDVIERDGERRTLGRDALAFSYRRSNLADRIVTAVTFALERVDDRAALRERLKQVMRYKKDSQPMAANSAGCAFKNPPREASEHGAGWLIDHAGLKGCRVGGAEVSHRHANFIVLHDGGTADDVLAVMEQVQAAVAARFGVTLEREVVVWNDGA